MRDSALLRPGLKLLRLVWASPCSLLGLLLALLPLLAGGRVRRREGALEFVCGGRGTGLLSRLPFAAITFGHVIIGVSAASLDRFGAHERVHVAQYERWGPLFLLLYPLSSLSQWLRGRHPYWDNAFEVQAYACAPHDPQAAVQGATALPAP